MTRPNVVDRPRYARKNAEKFSTSVPRIKIDGRESATGIISRINNPIKSDTRLPLQYFIVSNPAPITPRTK